MMLTEGDLIKKGDKLRLISRPGSKWTPCFESIGHRVGDGSHETYKKEYMIDDPPLIINLQQLVPELIRCYN